MSLQRPMLKECEIRIEPLPPPDPKLKGKIDVRSYPWAEQRRRRISVRNSVRKQVPPVVLEEPVEPPAQFPVERIVNISKHKGQVLYLVKWVGFPFTQCSWISPEDLQGDQKILEEFKRRLVIAARIMGLINDEHKKRVEFVAEREIDLGHRTSKIMEFRYENYYFPLYGNPDVNYIYQRRCLKWETDMNLLNRKKGHAPIYVENWVDEEAKPEGFVFVLEYIYHTSAEGIIKKNPNPAHLACTKKKHCCSNWYKKNCLQSKFFNEHLKECTPICGCGPGCKNRYTQKGRRVPLVLFRTVDRGWSVRAAVDMRKGTFVSEYFGEIISPAEMWNREVSTYMFDIYFDEVAPAPKKKGRRRKAGANARKRAARKRAALKRQAIDEQRESPKTNENEEEGEVEPVPSAETEEKSQEEEMEVEETQEESQEDDGESKDGSEGEESQEEEEPMDQQPSASEALIQRVSFSDSTDLEKLYETFAVSGAGTVSSPTTSDLNRTRIISTSSPNRSDLSACFADVNLPSPISKNVTAHTSNVHIGSSGDGFGKNNVDQEQRQYEECRGHRLVDYSSSSDDTIKGDETFVIKPESGGEKERIDDKVEEEKRDDERMFQELTIVDPTPTESPGSQPEEAPMPEETTIQPEETSANRSFCNASAANNSGASSTTNPDLIIDSNTFGNESRFFNNSCNPNMIAMKVFSDCYDRRMHRICFFTNKDVRRGEELTFNYYAGKQPEGFTTNFHCLCLHENCISRDY
ncbi:unnamed protein product [Bursaphelenchus xylophilus]|uniref:(pine wood nematode) hypothetical protein n=1 Tax=Bursaphelenchus xylophilus TaxID=6326 RepID=A0A1I7RVF2_BURXY|nr:unnamed protein product [Bursaphelenchus xylophilus]CAG9086758.1 unnamed protein product [Bursaphelenchus xylophilus]